MGQNQARAKPGKIFGAAFMGNSFFSSVGDSGGVRPAESSYL